MTQAMQLWIMTLLLIWQAAVGLTVPVSSLSQIKLNLVKNGALSAQEKNFGNILKESGESLIVFAVRRPG